MAKSNNGMDLFEVASYGPIGAVDEETQCLVTCNGSYLNFWVYLGDRKWENTDVISRDKDMWETSAAKMWEDCKKALENWLRDPDEEKAVKCECGAWTGESCEWEGPKSETAFSI